MVVPMDHEQFFLFFCKLAIFPLLSGLRFSAFIFFGGARWFPFHLRTHPMILEAFVRRRAFLRSFGGAADEVGRRVKPGKHLESILDSHKFLWDFSQKMH